MKISKITIFFLLFLFFPVISFSREISDIRSEISAMKTKYERLQTEFKGSSGERAEELANDIYHVFLDTIDLYEEVADKTEDKETARKIRESNSHAREEADRLYYSLMQAAKLSYPPIADNISVIETARSYGYVTVSAKVDISNQGEARKIFLTLRGVNAMGYQIEDIFLSGVVEEGENITLTDTTMLSEQEFLDVRSWEIGDLKYYRK